MALPRKKFSKYAFRFVLFRMNLFKKSCSIGSASTCVPRVFSKLMYYGPCLTLTNIMISMVKSCLMLYIMKMEILIQTLFNFQVGYNDMVLRV